MKVSAIPVVIGALGTIPTCLMKGLEEMEDEFIQASALLRSAKISRRALGT